MVEVLVEIEMELVVATMLWVGTGTPVMLVLVRWLMVRWLVGGGGGG